MPAPIYFATNRNVVLNADPLRFGSGFAEGQPYYFRVGKVEVTRTGDPWKDPEGAYRTESPELYEERPADPEKGMAEVLGSTVAFDVLRNAMREDPRDVVIYIHGFAASFEITMQRAAQLADAYLSPPRDPETATLRSRGREPLVFAFSWPSAGMRAGDVDPDPDVYRWAYAGDKQNARVSGPAIARATLRLLDYLSSLKKEEQCGQRLHLVAHSMGNWALLHAVQALFELAEEKRIFLPPIFDTAFLMASDVDDDALEDERGLKPLLRLAKWVHIYHAEDDTALALSNPKIGHLRRLGLFGPRRMSVLPDRVTAIDCSSVSRTPADGLVRHQYYRLAPEVTKDVRAVLAGKAPDEITGRAPGTGPNRWRIRLDTAARKKLSGGG